MVVNSFLFFSIIHAIGAIIRSLCCYFLSFKGFNWCLASYKELRSILENKEDGRFLWRNKGNFIVLTNFALHICSIVCTNITSKKSFLKKRGVFFDIIG